MAGNPSWWAMHSHESSLASSSSSSASPAYASVGSSSDTVYGFSHLPAARSWSQLLLGGGFQPEKKLEVWEDEVVNLSPSIARVPLIDVKQELVRCTSQQLLESESWRHLPVSSSSSFVTDGVLDFSGDKVGLAPAADGGVKSQKQSRRGDHASQCINATMAPDGVSKKARVQASSPQPALKVRKEKLGDRITALHQLVSPFGKTDTASVLSEAIGYIGFLQTQVEALSSPYMRTQHSVQERSCLFSEEGGQESKRGGQGKDLRSRGLCLVPISCTQHVGNDTGADYWAPSSLGGGF